MDSGFAKMLKWSPKGRLWLVPKPTQKVGFGTTPKSRSLAIELGRSAVSLGSRHDFAPDSGLYLSMTSPPCKPGAPPRGCSPGLPPHGPAWPQDVAITDVARAAAGPRVAAVARALGISPTAVRVGVARLPGRAPTSRPGAGRVGGGEAARAACMASASYAPGCSLSPWWTPHEPPAGAARCRCRWQAGAPQVHCRGPRRGWGKNKAWQKGHRFRRRLLGARGMSSPPRRRVPPSPRAREGSVRLRRDYPRVTEAGLSTEGLRRRGLTRHAY
jgi:hypothetical protein